MQVIEQRFQNNDVPYSKDDESTMMYMYLYITFGNLQSSISYTASIGKFQEFCPFYAIKFPKSVNR